MKDWLLGLTSLVCFMANGQSVPTNQIYLADPAIYQDKGTYFLYGTVEGDASNGFKAYQSSDLKSWKESGQVLKKGESFGDKGFWAPQVFQYKSRYVMAYVANEEIAVAYAEKPQGPFKQQQIQALAAPVKQIDPFVFIDDDGKIYLYHVRLDRGNRIFVARMNDDLSATLDDTAVECIHATDAWENTTHANWPVTEGPSVLKRNGRYYLFYTANDFRNPDYAVGYAVADSPLGPWKKYSGNPIISKSNIGFNGTGHGDFFFDKKKGLHYVLHTHNSPSQVGKRRTAVIKIKEEKTGKEVRFVPELSTFGFLEAKQ